MNKTRRRLFLLKDEMPPFIFRDEFLDDRAAGAINGTLSTDGKATRTVVDTGNKMSISNGVLQSPGFGTGVNDPAFTEGSFSRTAGLAIFARLKNETGKHQIILGFDNARIRTGTAGELACHNDVNVTGIETIPQNAFLYQAVITRATGEFFLLKVTDLWKIFWVNTTDTEAIQKAVVYGHSAYDADTKIDFLRVAQLPAPFTADYGIATQRLAGARSSGDTFVHEADCIVGYTVVTLKDNIHVTIRDQDFDNRWYIQTNENGAIYLVERVGGSNTTRGSAAAGSIANGQRIVIIAEGTTIKVFANNVLKITYGSASNFSTSKTGKIYLGTGGAISELATWPRTLPGFLQSMLNRYVK